jgi:glycosyltransferase involved in cell wall biosynthesis
MSAPAVSIILPTYNRLEYLKEAVESVRAQTFTDWELIVVDDGSTDASVAWVEALCDPRISVIALAHSGNKSRVRNAGLSRARGDWIAFNDSDDRWAPRKLERQLIYHAVNRQIRWSYTGRVMIDAEGRPMPATLFKPWKPYAGRILERVLSLEANIALPSVMAERALVSEAGGFDETRSSAEDYDLWVRLAERCECGVLDEPLLEVRKHRAAGHQRPDVSLGFTAIYTAFAVRTNDPALRSLSMTHAAYHAVDAADRLALSGAWPEARSALAAAWRIRPLSLFTYRAMVRFAARRLRAVTSRPSAPAA